MQAFDPARAEAFAERFVSALNESAFVLMASVGHRTGLFDTMADLPPSTSEQIAEAAGRNERYVREWLGSMVAAQVVTYDAATKCYELPAEYASLLTRRNTPNLAATAQWVPVLGAVEDPIVACFERGGGVPYEAYDRFHHVMAEESAQTIVAALDDEILPRMPGMRERLEEGIDVLDVGCGSGRAVNWLARRFPKSRFTGFDLCEDAIAAARAEAARDAIPNVTFKTCDVAQMDAYAAFDLITTFDAVHDQADPARVLRNIQAALRPAGVYFMQEIRASSHPENNVEHPLGAFLYTISCMHCMSVSLSQDGAGLGAVWGKETALDYLRNAGFEDVDVHEPEHDIMSTFFVSTKAQVHVGAMRAGAGITGL